MLSEDEQLFLKWINSQPADVRKISISVSLEMPKQFSIAFASSVVCF